MNRFLFLVAMTILTTIPAFSQTDNPCGATALTLNTACVYQAGTNVGATNTTGVPAPGCANYSGKDVWYTFTAPANGSVTVDMNVGTMTDSGMAWYRGVCGSLTLIECDDDDSPNGAMSMISSTCLTPGETIWVRIWKYGGGTGTFQVCATTPTGAVTGSSLCGNMQPICSGTPITFPALSGGSSAFICNPGNNYGCLLTTPNPTWYYLQIATGGNLAVDMAAASDIDFAMWGPYTNLTTAKAACGALPAPIDCSYSTAATEQAHATGTVTNQVYVLVVTNYANVPQTVTVTTAGGSTATTNCAIVLPVELSDFDVKQEGRNVRLNWKTETENNANYFIVERSANGSLWQAIGMKPASGTTTEAHVYSYIDEKSLTGMYYYRLKQVDFNGKAYLSPVRAIHVETNAPFLVYPNPATKLFNVDLEANDPLVSLELYSLEGSRIALPQDITDATVQLDCSQVLAGTYQLVIQTERRFSKQLVVIR